MKRIAIVYWSGTGHTETMAKYVASGAKKAGANVHLFTAAEFCPEQIELFDAIAFGCPSMGVEQLEEEEFEPLFTQCKEKLSGKRIGLFGSYGWGNGEWMQNWEDDCRSIGADLIGEGVICQEEPDESAESACALLGKMLAD